MREIDLLLREFSQKKLDSMKHEDIQIFDAILDHDDQKLFEFITLESAQAGLSWYTVIKNVRIILRRSTILILL